jgi:hypothetical protein
MGEPCDATTLVSRLGRVYPPPSIVGFFNGAVQPDLDQMQHAPIDDPARAMEYAKRRQSDTRSARAPMA